MKKGAVRRGDREWEKTVYGEMQTLACACYGVLGPSGFGESGEYLEYSKPKARAGVLSFLGSPLFYIFVFCFSRVHEPVGEP